MRKNKLVPYVPDYATAPGEVIEGYLESFGMDRTDLARHLDLDPEATERLLTGASPVTPEIAAALERLFQRPAQLWLGMEAVYQKHKRRLEHRVPRPGTSPRSDAHSGVPLT